MTSRTALRAIGSPTGVIAPASAPDRSCVATRDTRGASVSKRAAIVEEAEVNGGRKPASSSRLSPTEFAALGIVGLRSKDSVRRYVRAWMDQVGVRPEPRRSSDSTSSPASRPRSRTSSQANTATTAAANDHDHEHDRHGGGGHDHAVDSSIASAVVAVPAQVRPAGIDSHADSGIGTAPVSRRSDSPDRDPPSRTCRRAAGHELGLGPPGVAVPRWASVSAVPFWWRFGPAPGRLGAPGPGIASASADTPRRSPPRPRGSSVRPPKGRGIPPFRRPLAPTPHCFQGSMQATHSTFNYT